MAIIHSVGARNLSISVGIDDAFDTTGVIEIRTGARPSDPELALSGTLLGTLTLAAAAFGTPTGGVITAAAIGSDTSADNSGTAGYFCILLSGSGSGATGNNPTTSTATTHPRIMGTCGTSGADMNFDNNVIVAGGTIAVSSLTLAAPP